MNVTSLTANKISHSVGGKLSAQAWRKVDFFRYYHESTEPARRRFGRRTRADRALGSERYVMVSGKIQIFSAFKTFNCDQTKAPVTRPPQILHPISKPVIRKVYITLVYRRRNKNMQQPNDRGDGFVSKPHLSENL